MRMDVREKRGDWEELVDPETGITIYYNARLGTIKYEKPKRWVKMLAKQFETTRETGRTAIHDFEKKNKAGNTKSMR